MLCIADFKEEFAEGLQPKLRYFYFMSGCRKKNN